MTQYCQTQYRRLKHAESDRLRQFDRNSVVHSGKKMIHQWKFWAIVQPEKVLAQMGMEQLVKDYSAAGITAKFFTDPNEAMKGLEAQ